jgi:hypothetical protein
VDVIVLANTIVCKGDKLYYRRRLKSTSCRSQPSDQMNRMLNISVRENRLWSLETDSVSENSKAGKVGILL